MQCTQHISAFVLWAQVELIWKTRFFASVWNSPSGYVFLVTVWSSVDLSSSLSVWNLQNNQCLASGGKSGKFETRGYPFLFQRKIGFKSWKIRWHGYGTAILLCICPPTEGKSTNEYSLSTSTFVEYLSIVTNQVYSLLHTLLICLVCTLRDNKMKQFLYQFSKMKQIFFNWLFSIPLKKWYFFTQTGKISSEVGPHSIRSGTAMAMFLLRWNTSRRTQYWWVSHLDPRQRNHPENAKRRKNVGGNLWRCADLPPFSSFQWRGFNI